MQAFLGIFILALVVEAIVEYFLPTFPDPYKWTKIYIAAILGVLVCVAYEADLLAALGLPSVRYVGSILTGLVIGRGANFVNVFIKRVGTVPFPAQSVDSVPDAPLPQGPRPPL